MASGGIYEELTQIVSCEICLEPLQGRNPRVLPCSHIFCEKCLQRLLDGAKATDPHTSSISCPVCRQQVKIPGSSAANLPLFYYLSKVENIRTDIRDRYKICKMCKSAAHKAHVTSYCFVCVSGHCDKCRINHDEVFHNHAQISVTQSTINSIMCAEHDAHFSHFCMTCSKAVCNHCYVGKHCHHKVYDLAYDGKKVQENLKEFLLSGMKSADETLATLVKLESKLSRDIKTAMEEMKHHQDYLLKLVTDQYEALCLELNQRETDIKNDLKRSKQLVETAKQCIDRLLKQTESWHEPVKGVPEARIKNIGELIADVKQKMPSLHLVIKVQTVKFARSELDIAFGKILQETLHFALVEFSGSLKGQMAATVQRKDVSVGPTLLQELEPGDNIRDIDYLVNGHLVVCMPNALCVYNGQCLLSNHSLAVSCRPSGDGELCSVCVCKKTGKVVVLEFRYPGGQGYLHVYRPDGERWQYNRYQVCKCPVYVSVTSCGEYVVYSGMYGMSLDCNLYKYNTVGKEMWSIDMRRDGVVFDVSVGNFDRIFVCHQNKVVVYNKDGKQMSSFSTTGRKLEPRGVCVNKNGEIFVSGGRSRDVLLLSDKHYFVKSLIHFDYVPCKISVYKNFRLSVCDSNNKKVYVYKV